MASTDTSLAEFFGNVLLINYSVTKKAPYGAFLFSIKYYVNGIVTVVPDTPSFPQTGILWNAVTPSQNVSGI